MLTAKQAHQAVIERHKKSIEEYIDNKILYRQRKAKYEVKEVSANDLAILSSWLEKLGYQVNIKEEDLCSVLSGKTVMMYIEW